MQKRAIICCLDLGLVPASFYMAIRLRFGKEIPWDQVEPSLILMPILMTAVLVTSLLLGIDRIKLHAMDTSAVTRIGVLAGVLVCIGIVSSFMFQLGSPRSIPLIFAAVFFCSAVLMRHFGLLVLHFLGVQRGNNNRVAVYGAGAAGIQLVSALRHSTEVMPVTFVDDNPSLHGTIIAGLKVVPFAALEDMAQNGKLDCVLVAIPSLSRKIQGALVDRLNALPGQVSVRVLPSYVDMVVKGTDAVPVEPDVLLGRDKVELDIPDIAEAYTGKTILVTGAGGSIGSELCRQILKCKPSKLVLFELSELNLYEIERELRPFANDAGMKLVARLGSVTNRERIESIMREENVQVVLHAAAYKHVPLVEENELEGAHNNVLGTMRAAQAAEAAGVERFILVSTDKAVRPTNIMGATKRMAELVIQDLQTRSEGTVFSMVRFGNVLGSSGSVLPLFQKQISVGGPVTVTHREVIRYFMTIPEAARLVLLAGAYSTGGDVFVLDMGKPQKIYDIARRMIELSGQRVKELGEADGIEIKITGLRPGEKLYEELLIDGNSLVGTPHPKIMRAEEFTLSEIEVKAMLNNIQIAQDERSADHLRATVKRFVDGYKQPQLSQERSDFRAKETAH